MTERGRGTLCRLKCLYYRFPVDGGSPKRFWSGVWRQPLKPTVPYASDIFHQIGSKGVSFGRILAIGPGVLAHNCSLLNGASGSRFLLVVFTLTNYTHPGFIVKIDEDRLTFVGVHISGDFNQVCTIFHHHLIIKWHVFRLRPLLTIMATLLVTLASSCSTQRSSIQSSRHMVAFQSPLWPISNTIKLSLNNTKNSFIMMSSQCLQARRRSIRRRVRNLMFACFT